VAELARVKARLDVIGDKPPDEAKVYERLGPVQHRLSQVGSDLDDNCNDMIHKFSLALYERGGDKIDDMSIDFWQLNTFELPFFQGEKATLAAVKSQMETWIEPFSELMMDFTKECDRSINSAITDLEKLDSVPSSLLAKAREMWMEDASKAVEAMSDALIPPNNRAEWIPGRDGESDLEKKMTTPPPHTMTKDEMNAYLTPEPVKALANMCDEAKQRLVDVARNVTREEFDPNSGQEPPMMIQMLIVVRQRILDGAKAWVGCGSAYANPTGQMNGFISMVRSDIKKTCNKFSKFGMKMGTNQSCLECLKEDNFGPERGKLLKHRDLLQHAMYEVDKL